MHANDGQQQIPPENLEVGVLQRDRRGRKFHRLSTDTLTEKLGG
jgi:hypothetical protein